MTKILLLSDSHSYTDDKILKYAAEADEIWHAGDWGIGVDEKLEKLNKPIKGVYGNIDDQNIRAIFPEFNEFECDGLKVLMVHIAGKLGVYNSNVIHQIKTYQPDVLICGHSHILKISKDPKYPFIYINPGACGTHGFHAVRTMIRMEISDKKIQKLEVIELGNRGKIS